MPDPILEDIFREHLPYEIDMLRDTYWSLVSAPPSSFDMNVLIESFSVHARSLLDFFSCNNKTHDDAISSDFTSGYAPILSIDVEPLKSIRVKLNKQVFHLTTNRTIHDAVKFDPSSDGWEVVRQIESE